MNRPAKLIIDGSVNTGVNHIYTDETSLIGGVSVVDDGVQQLRLNVTMREGTLRIQEKAWYLQGPVYGQYLEIMGMQREELSELSWSAVRYSMTGSAAQLDAAVRNLTYTVNSEENLDGWREKPIQDIAMQFTLVDGEFVAETTMLFVVSDTKNGSLYLVTNNISSNANISTR
jgi:hypothetical protein